MNKINFKLKFISLMHLLSIVMIFLLGINSQQNIKILNVKSFFEQNIICGDKFLAKTFDGEIYISTDFANNWQKIDILSSIKKIKNFEASKLKEKKHNKKNPEFTFIKNLFIKRFLKNENLENYFKLQTHNENVVFITIKGEIVFSAQCGLDLLNKKTLAENLNFDNDRHVEDFIFHPINKDKGIIICKDDSQNIFLNKEEQNSSRFLKDVYLTKDFGKSFHKIESLKHENLRKFYNLNW